MPVVATMPWHVALSNEQLLEVAHASGGDVAYGDALEVEYVDGDAGGRFLCCAWPSYMKGESRRLGNVDLQFQLRSSVACDEERSSVDDEGLFVDAYDRRVRVTAPTTWPSPPDSAHTLWICLAGQAAPKTELSPQMKLRLRTALGGQLVCAGGSFDLSRAAPRGDESHPRIKVVRVLGSGGAALPVARVSVRTQLKVVDDAHASVGFGARAAQTPTLNPDEFAIFPAQRRAYDALCALLRASAPPQADLLRQWSVRPPSGLLLSGPPGTGKTHVVRTVATRFNVPLVAFSGAADGGTVVDTQCDDVGNAFSSDAHPSSESSPEGEVGARLQAAFELADRLARRVSASRGHACSAILFLDELDAICPKRSDASTSAELNRCVAVALTLLDGLRSRHGRVLAVGATNRPHALDEALRRPGRLEWEVPLTLPSAVEREAALRSSCAKVQVDDAVDLQRLAASCNGFAAADLVALVREATLCAARRMRLDSMPTASPDDDVCACRLIASDFEAATASVRASALRPSDTSTPPVEPLPWSEVGGVDDVKRRIRRAVEWPTKHAAAYQRLGIDAPRGVLLHGPPGCAKTSLARAAAGASGVTFVYLSGATLYSAYVGEAERQLRDFFALGRACAPSILFIDELDAIVGSRSSIATGGGGGRDGGEGVPLRVLSTLLNEMDGVSGASRIILIGATNRPDALDAALLRPGRFDEVIEVPPPDEAGRVQVLQVHTRRMPLADDVNLERIASECDGWSGAELSALCREAAMHALRESINCRAVGAHNFDAALAQAGRGHRTTYTL